MFILTFFLGLRIVLPGGSLFFDGHWYHHVLGRDEPGGLPDPGV